MRIAVIGGDGTGPEVVAEGLKVLEAVAGKVGFEYETTDFDVSGERYLAAGGNPNEASIPIISDDEIDRLRKFDAIYLGAVGHPDVAPGILEKGILLKARFELDQYINLRPVRLYPGVDSPLKDKGPDEIDYVVVRENTGDAYTGTGGFTMKGTPNEVAVQSAVYNRFQVDRCLRYAFEYARKHGKKAQGKGEKNTLALCGKTNVLTYIYDLWERAFHEMGQAEYPDIEREYYHVDATCMWMVKNPEWFDVIVTGNMFGDIITDLGAITQGGMGIAAGGNINPEGVSMFEPIHGSAPKHAGKNVACPIAAISAAGMMMEHLGEVAVGKAIEDAVVEALGSGKLGDLSTRSGVKTTEAGDLVASLV